MYNEEVKNAYLSTLDEKVRLITKSLFNKSESLEIFKGKDLVKFSKNDILYLLTFFETNSIGSLRQRNQQIRSYKEWYIKKYKDSDVVQFEIKKKDFQMCLRLNEKKYFTEEMINDLEQKQGNPFVKFIIQALFEGIKGTYLSELTLAKMEHINKKTRTMKVYNCKSFEATEIITEEREIVISDKLIALAEECYNTHVIMSKEGLIAGYLDEEGYIIKNKTNRGTSIMTGKQVKSKVYGIVQRLNSCSYQGDLPITASTIFNSGILHQIKNNQKDFSFVEKQYNISKSNIQKILDNVE